MLMFYTYFAYFRVKYRIFFKNPGTEWDQEVNVDQEEPQDLFPGCTPSSRVCLFLEHKNNHQGYVTNFTVVVSGSLEAFISFYIFQ